MIKYFFMFIISLSTADDKTYQSVLESLYQDCKLNKEILYLTEDQVKSIEKISKSKVYSKLKVRYFNECSKNYIYLDSHIVRTLNETLLLEVKEKSLHKLELVSFLEPKEYRPPLAWLKKFEGKKLSSQLKIGEDVDALSGATLTANAITKSTKKILAIDQVINEKK